jgi:hypothetical protein
MYCCPNCFADTFLGKHIEANNAGIDDCSFCDARATTVMAPDSLADKFQPIINLYATCSEVEGIPYITQLEDDWAIFKIEDEEIKKALLSAILGDNTLVGKKCKPLIVPDEERVDKWNEFKDELKHINRYFPKKVPEYEEFKNLLFLLTLPDTSLPAKLFRARICTDNDLLECDKMGMPDKLRASNGRANPRGIPYLYTASDERTAIAEVRPHKGDIVSVATFELKKSLKFADLRHPKMTISPFEIEEDDLRRLYQVMPLLIHLGEELARPVLPREADLEYLASQYLCEFVKDVGFDGVIYKSSLEDGDNYAIFHEELIKCLEVSHYRITDIKLNFEPCDS